MNQSTGTRKGGGRVAATPSRGTWLSIYVPARRHDQYQKTQIPNRTSSTMPGELLFLSAGALVFRHVGSGRTSRSTRWFLVRNSTLEWGIALRLRPHINKHGMQSAASSLKERNQVVR